MAYFWKKSKLPGKQGLTSSQKKRIIFVRGRICEKYTKKKTRYESCKYSAKELQKKCDEYFNKCDTTTWKEVISKDGKKKKITKPYTITGLCLHLDISRETLAEWGANEGKGLSKIVKNAKNRIVEYIECNLATGQAIVGEIFRMKNIDSENWRDRVDHNQHLSGNIVVQWEDSD